MCAVNILQSLGVMSDTEKDKQRARAALTEVLNMDKGLSEDFDPRKELEEARTEKYDNPDSSDGNKRLRRCNTGEVIYE